MSVELVSLNPVDARALTDRIKVGVEAVWELVKQAYEQRAWDALGYSSWDDYCTREFGTTRLRLPREERAEVVASLRESGLSVRAIAAATGVNRETVRQEVAALPGDNKLSPEPIEPESESASAQCIHCHNTLPLAQLYEGGQGYECDPCVSPGEPLVDFPEQELPPLPENYTVAPTSPEPRPITGLDGKTYTPRATTTTPTTRRKPLTDTAREIGLDLHKMVGRIERFVADDRFGRNKNEVAPHLRHHLAEVIKACQGLENQLAQGA